MRIRESFGFTFPIVFMILAFFLIIMGLSTMAGKIDRIAELSSITKNILGLLQIIGGGFIITSKEGVEFDFEDMKMRKYSSSFGIEYGKWRDLSQFKYIAITSKQMSYNMSIRGAIPQEFRKQVFDIVILNENHLRKFVVQQADSLSSAKSKIKELSDKLGFEIVDYKPKAISSRRRR